MWSIRSFTFSPIQENTYILWNEDLDAIIIDPGCYHEFEKEELKDFITENRLSPKMLVNTHCHLDHVFGEKFVAETWSLEPHMHPNEQAVLLMGEPSGKMWGLPFKNYSGPLRFLREGETIKLGGDELEILFTPGHSPGHLCFYSKSQHFIISGDVLFLGSIGRTDLPGGNMEVLLQSIKTRLMNLPDQTIVYSGHGNATTIGHERNSNPFLVIAC